MKAITRRTIASGIALVPTLRSQQPTRKPALPGRGPRMKIYAPLEPRFNKIWMRGDFDLARIE